MKVSLGTFFPRPTCASKLFFTGATVGPVVDSLHNQCLLTYDLAPVTLTIPQFSQQPIFCSSWAVPPLLGVAYVVLGGVLPRLLESGAKNLGLLSEKETGGVGVPRVYSPLSSVQGTAISAVLSTAVIIKLSEFLQTHNSGSADQNLAVMVFAALTQWLILDGTPTSLLAATITAIGGPLSELPFVASGFWHYLPEAADYLPLSNLSQYVGSDASTLALSSITGPCYFAVTTDAIALGRWFDEEESQEDA